MRGHRSMRLTVGFLIIALLCQLGAWASLRDRQASWANVPPAPSLRSARMSMLGDSQLAYRAIGIMLQNLGNAGGSSRALEDYNYTRLGRWFTVEDQLDPQSNFVPSLAAFYFGATDDPQQLGPVVDYLEKAGESPYSNKWRWLAQAVYLARFKMNDLDRAMTMASKLAGMYRPGMPGWVTQMPVFIYLQQNDRQAAYNLALQILKDDADHMQVNEINFMRDYICERILTPEQAKQDALCQSAQ